MTDEPYDNPTEDASARTGEEDARPADRPEPEQSETTDNDAEPARDKPRDKRWVLARDVLVFQGKLALDALRDLILSPVSIIAALIGVFTKRDNPGYYFYDLMRWGRRSDKFINLFSAGQDPSEEDNFPSVDDLVSSLEDVIVKEHEKGGMTAEAKSHIDKTLDRLDETMERDRERAKRHIKAAADTVKREIKKVKDQVVPSSVPVDITPTTDVSPSGDEPPAPGA